jgi:hypothetical protein
MVTAPRMAPLAEEVGDGRAAGTTVSFPLVAVPLGVTTWIAPLVAPVGTVVVIWLALTTVKTAWSVVLNRTNVAPVKFVPLMVTVAPMAPLPGLAGHAGRASPRRKSH